MLTLYYAPGACSISPHIALRAAGLPFTLKKVDFMRGKRLEDGRPLSEVSPKGAVPVLVLEDGQLLTEGAAIVQYIADLRPEAKLAPAAGTFERVRLQEWLNYIGTELHKGLGPLFARDTPEGYRQAATEKVMARLAYVAGALAGRPFLMGDRYSVADGYLLYVLRAWQKFFKNDLPDGLGAYYARLTSLPAVQAALAAEGLD